MIQELTATPDARALQVTWETGETSTLTAETLRREAQDAWSRRERHDKGELRVAPGLVITNLAYVGGYGVNVQFSDGHERAIYPFAYLRELCDRSDK